LLSVLSLAALSTGLALVGCGPPAAQPPPAVATSTSAIAPITQVTAQPAPATEVTTSVQTECDLVCERVKRASFEPPHNGGTLRIHVPFSLRRVAPGEETF
jgi:hypothetical protein